MDFSLWLLITLIYTMFSPDLLIAKQCRQLQRVVEMIWQKTASLPSTHRSIVFASGANVHSGVSDPKTASRSLRPFSAVNTKNPDTLCKSLKEGSRKAGARKKTRSRFIRGVASSMKLGAEGWAQWRARNGDPGGRAPSEESSGQSPRWGAAGQSRRR